MAHKKEEKKKKQEELTKRGKDMKKRIISILMALVMITASAAFAVAEDQTGIRAVFQMSVNDEALSDLMKESDSETAKAIANLINGLKLDYAATGTGAAEIEVTLDGTPVTGAGFYTDEGKMKVVSSLFPKHVLEIPVPAMDERINMDEFVKPLTELYEEILQKAGEPENVTEYLLGNTFTSRRKVDLTTEELFEKAILAEKKIFESTQFKTLVQKIESMNGKVEIPDLDAAIKDMKEKDDLPQTEVYIYSDEKNNQIAQVDFLKDGDFFDFNIGNVNGNKIFEISGLESYYFYAEISPELLYVVADVDTNSMNTYISVKINAFMPADGKEVQATASVSVNDREFILATLDYEKCEIELSDKYSIMDQKVVGLEELQDPENEATSGFMIDLLTGVTNAIKEVIECVPEMGPVLQNIIPQN